MTTPHIIQLPRNTEGNDFIIGDVHGCNAGLRAVINALKDNDRLFIVGDLFDRGPDSIDVFNAIQQGLMSGKDIYVTRGNHEEMFLHMMRALNDFKDNPFYEENEKSKIAICDFLQNGGNWVFLNENDRCLFGQVRFDKNSFANFDYVSEFLERPLRTELSSIELYLSLLPYIILVGDIDDKINSFIVCHADMSISDAILNHRLTEKNPYLKGESLTPTDLKMASELTHLVWGRPDRRTITNPYYLLPSTDRNEESLIVYCGHSIICDYPSYNTRAVRPETNHINLDGGAFLYSSLQLFLRMNHTTKEIDFIGNTLEKDPTDVETLHINALDRASEIILSHIMELPRKKERQQLNLKRLDLIGRLFKATAQYKHNNIPKKSDGGRLALSTLFHSQDDIATSLLKRPSLSKNECILIELIAMIDELTNLVRDSNYPPHWTPGELATTSETYCCFFYRRTELNNFYHELIQLGGRPVKE